MARIPMTLSEFEGHFYCCEWQNASRSRLSASAELLVNISSKEELVTCMLRECTYMEHDDNALLTDGDLFIAVNPLHHCLVTTLYNNQPHRTISNLLHRVSIQLCHLSIFTTRCTIVQSAVLRSHVLCLSVCLSVCDVGGS